MVDHFDKINNDKGPKSIPIELWPTVDITMLSEAHLNIFKKNRKIVSSYISGASISSILDE